jgi:hypothetical protein
MTERYSLMNWFRGLLQNYRESRCSHEWRPVSLTGGYGKWCEDCHKIVELDAQDFYAQFGYMPRRWF